MRSSAFPWLALLPLALLPACGSGGAGGAAGAPAAPPGPSAAPPSVGARPASGPVAAAPTASASVSPSGSGKGAPSGKLRLSEARRRMLALVNRDRATQKLPPLTLDEGPAQRSGQRHAEDMAKNGFLGHWGTDGSTPEQRHTEAGGADMVLENASCMDDLKRRPLEADPLIDEAAIAHAQHLFFDEVPPNDGHRKNILKPHHTRVGIGIALPASTETEIGVPCFSQEFVDGYGTYGPIPARAKVGQMLHVEGSISPPAVFGGVGLARVESPRPLSPGEANKRRFYPVPVPYQVYWPRGFVTPIPVEVSGSTFRVDVPLSDGGKPGMYEVSIFGKLPGMTNHGILGVRTIEVTK